MADLTQSVMQACHEGELFTQEREPYDDEVLMCGYLIKLGHKVKSWRHRWAVVRGNGRLQYFKQSPSASKPLVSMRPKGEINLRRDCLELVSWKRCNIILSERVSEVGGRGFQSIRWHPSASEHSAFGIRTTYRTFLFVAPDGDAASWLRGLNEVCARCEIYEGIDQLPLTPRRASLPATQYQHREQQQQQQRQQQQQQRRAAIGLIATLWLSSTAWISSKKNCLHGCLAVRSPALDGSLAHSTPIPPATATATAAPAAATRQEMQVRLLVATAVEPQR